MTKYISVDTLLKEAIFPELSKIFHYPAEQMEEVFRGSFDGLIELCIYAVKKNHKTLQEAQNDLDGVLIKGDGYIVLKPMKFR